MPRHFCSLSSLRENVAEKVPATADLQAALPQYALAACHVGAIEVRDLSRDMSFRILTADHTGITVSNLERSLAFWRDVLGFELSHRAHQTGQMAEEITGVKCAELKLAVVKAPGGHKIELLEYLAPADRKKDVDPSTSLRTSLRPCDLGHVHVALIVDNLDTILEKIAASGWKAAGKPQTLRSGPNAGKRVIYVRDPDGTAIEFMQPPDSEK